MKRFARLVTVVAMAALWESAGKAQIICPAVTSAASFRLGIPAKGSIASLWCTGLQVQGIVLAETLPLPFELAGVRVWVGGAPAPLFGLAEGPGYQQINVEVPQEAQFGTSIGEQFVSVEVQQNGQRGPGLPVALSSPGEFFLWPGTDFGIFQHAEDYSLVTPDNPARPGETLIGYLTGMPGTDPTVPTGEPAPSDPPAIVPNFYYSVQLQDAYRIYAIDECSAGVCPIAADIPLAELTPGLVGVYQIRIVLRPSVEAGNRQLMLTRTRCFYGCTSASSSPTILPVR